MPGRKLMAKNNMTLISEALKNYGPGALSFLVGEPWFTPDEELVQALGKAASQSHLYSPPGGLPELKEKICQLESRRGLNISSENIIIGNGSKSLLFALLALKGKGGVITPVPAYPPMLLQPGMSGHVLKTVSTLEDEGRIKIKSLEKLSVNKGVFVFSSPGNPGGQVLSPGEQEELLHWADKSENILAADEVYCDFVFQKKMISLAAIRQDLKNVAVVRSFSKSLGICGWRLGYLIAAAELIEELTRWQTLALNPPSTLVQKALASLPFEKLKASEEKRIYFESLADELAALFSETGIEFLKPEGGFYLFLKLESLIEKSGLCSSFEFCRSLAQEQGVALWPGEDFGAPGWARLAFGNVNPETKNEQINLLKQRINKFISF